MLLPRKKAWLGISTRELNPQFTELLLTTGAIYNVNYREENKFWYGCQTDIDNHTGTHCFGRKFSLTAFTSQKCTVSPLLEECTEKMNIPICSAGTKYTLRSG